MDNIDNIAKVFQENTLFIEYGSGSSLKTRLLLDHLDNLAGYVPIDISEEHLNKTVASLQEEYPDLEIHSLAADYTKPFELPEIHHKIEHKITFFPGSTIGNFSKKEAREFLKLIAETCGEAGGLLIGVDLHKDKDILEAVYNDKENVTAAFNLNMLERINNEFGANFDLDNFRHYAYYNEEHHRIEMHLVSEKDQTVVIDDDEFHFKKCETILTEYSHKYTFNDFGKLAEDYFEIKRIWTDKNNYFSIQYLAVK